MRLALMYRNAPKKVLKGGQKSAMGFARDAPFSLLVERAKAHR